MGKIMGKGAPLPSRHAEEGATRVASLRLIGAHVEELVHGGNFEEALEVIDGLLEREPNLLGALFQKGMTLGYMGDHAAALALFEQCCERAPGDAVCWYQKGVALTEVGNTSQAIQAYQKAQELDPSDASTEFNLGVLLIRTGHFEEGRRHIEAAVKNGHPRAPEALQQMSALSASAPQSRKATKLGRNEPCHCGSGLKFKKCHGK